MSRVDLILGAAGTLASAAALLGFAAFLHHVYRQEHPRT